MFNGATAFTLEDLCYLKEGGDDKEEAVDGSGDENGNFCEHKCQSCSILGNALIFGLSYLHFRKPKLSG